MSAIGGISGASLFNPNTPGASVLAAVQAIGQSTAALDQSLAAVATGENSGVAGLAAAGGVALSLDISV